MAKILLDYVFPISVVATVPAASTAFLKQVCVVAKPKSGQEGNVGQVFVCTSTSQVAARTDNENCTQLFAAGMSKVYLLLSDDLDIADVLEENKGVFWTVLISDDFVDGDLGGNVTVPAVASSVKIQDITYTAVTPGEDGDDITITYVDGESDGGAVVTIDGTDIEVSIEAGVTTAEDIADAVNEHVGASALVTAVVDTGDEEDPQAAVTETPLADGADETSVAGDIDAGAFDGVIGFSSDDIETVQIFATQENRCGFLTSSENGAENMFYAFGKLLSNLANWTNQQYISMPLNDGIEALGDAETAFESKVSFVINDTEFGSRLALFCVGGKAITAPYIGKNLRVDLQGRALQWIAANQPGYTLKNAALLEQRLQEDIVNERYIATGWIEAGVVDVRLLQDNFVASGSIDIAEPKALWRIVGEMRSTL